MSLHETHSRFPCIITLLCTFRYNCRCLLRCSSKNRDDEAQQILSKIYPDGYDVWPVVADIREALEREEAAERAVGWKVIFKPTRALRRMLLVGVGTAIAQQAVGIDAIQ